MTSRSLIAAAPLAALTWLVRRGRTRDADQQVASRIGESRGAADRVSYLAQPRMILLETVALALLPGLDRDERAAILTAPLVAGLAGHALKLLVPRDRPGQARFSPQGDQSFPSTHAAHATALALILATVARRHGRRPRGAALLAAAAIGLARIRASAHWPTDVLAGWLLGAAGAGVAELVALRR